MGPQIYIIWNWVPAKTESAHIRFVRSSPSSAQKPLMAFHLIQSKKVITKAKKASMPLQLISFHWIQLPRPPRHFQNLLVNVYMRAFPRVVPSAWKAPPWASLMDISLSPQSLSAQMSHLLKERTSLIKLILLLFPTHPWHSLFLLTFKIFP